MQPLFRFANPIRLDKKTKIGQIRGADLYVHWTVFLVAAVILASVASRPALSLVGLCAYWGVLLLHETGHLIAARRFGCPVFSIELYPIFGITRFGTPWSRMDHCMIAWGGVIAQAVIAVPVALWVLLLGYTRFEVVNMVLVILGFFSLGVAIFNLLPIPSFRWSNRLRHHFGVPITAAGSASKNPMSGEEAISMRNESIVNRYPYPGLQWSGNGAVRLQKRDQSFTPEAHSSSDSANGSRQTRSLQPG